MNSKFFIWELYLEILIQNLCLEILIKRKKRQKFLRQFPLNSFSIPVGELYIRKYFNAESKAVAAGLVDEVREALKKILRELPWMDNQTRNAAIRKANTMNSFVAYPDGTDDEVELENYYNGFEMETNNFFKNILHVMRFNKDKEYRKLHHPINEGRWLIRSNTASVNAFNLRNDNSIRKSF